MEYLLPCLPWEEEKLQGAMELVTKESLQVLFIFHWLHVFFSHGKPFQLNEGTEYQALPYNALPTS